MTRILCALLIIATAHAQRGTGDWSTAAYDAQRSSWVRGDGKISYNTMSKPGFGLVWKLKFNNNPRGANSVTPPSLIDFYIGYKGFRTLGFFGGSSNRVIAVDTDIARVEWEKSYPVNPAAPTTPCPGGMTAGVTRPTSASYPPLFAARGAGRSTPAKSGVGAAYEGAVTLRNTPPPRPPVAVAKPAANTPAVPNPFAPRVQYAIALTGDGKLHLLYISNGEEPNPATQFLPPNASAYGLIGLETQVYAATANGCGGVPDAVWALDLNTKKVSQWKSPGGSIAGNAGPAIAPDGTVYAATTGGFLAALAPGTLEQKSIYKNNGGGFVSSPVIFDYQGRMLIAAATAHGRFQVLDPGNLQSNTPLTHTDRFGEQDYPVGSLTSWQDPAGVRWILAPQHRGHIEDKFPTRNGEANNGAIVAYKLTDQDGKFTLQPAWVSRDMPSPLAPIVVNGVVFAIASGRDAKSPAILYALDALSGKEIWNSGTAIASFVTTGGLSAGGGRVYLSDHAGTQYAFGFPMETLDAN